MVYTSAQAHAGNEASLNGLLALPCEVLDMILSYLQTHEQLSIVGTCRHVAARIMLRLYQSIKVMPVKGPDEDESEERRFRAAAGDATTCYDANSLLNTLQAHSERKDWITSLYIALDDSPGNVALAQLLKSSDTLRLFHIWSLDTFDTSSYQFKPSARTIHSSYSKSFCDVDHICQEISALSLEQAFFEELPGRYRGTVHIPSNITSMVFGASQAPHESLLALVQGAKKLRSLYVYDPSIDGCELSMRYRSSDGSDRNIFEAFSAHRDSLETISYTVDPLPGEYLQAFGPFFTTFPALKSLRIPYDMLAFQPGWKGSVGTRVWSSIEDLIPHEIEHLWLDHLEDRLWLVCRTEFLRFVPVEPYESAKAATEFFAWLDCILQCRERFPRLRDISLLASNRYLQKFEHLINNPDLSVAIARFASYGIRLRAVESRSVGQI